MQNLFNDLYINKIFFTSIVLFVTLLIVFLLKKGIDLIFIGVKKKVQSSYILSKTATIRLLLKNIVDVVLFLLALLIILSHWGINITPILTGAGILGLAFSFGAQTLVKDLIAGFFIIAEDQFNVGDRVKIGNFEGEVHKITLRLTILKDKNENLIYIPNSQITTIMKLK